MMSHPEIPRQVVKVMCWSSAWILPDAGMKYPTLE